jgi:hypothetical protein
MWNFSQSPWQDKPWLGQVMGDFFRRDAQRAAGELREELSQPGEQRSLVSQKLGLHP